MSWGSVQSIGNTQDKSSGPSIQMTTVGGNVPVGDVIVVVVAKDNSGTSDTDSGVEFTQVTDGAGNVYTKARERVNGSPGAGNGAVAAIFFTKVTTQLNSGATITASFSVNITASAISAWRFTIGAGNVVSVEGGATGSPEEGTTTPSVTLSGLASGEYLWVAATAVEGPIGQGFTQDSDYTSMNRQGTTGGGVTTNMTINPAFRIFSGTSDTYAPTLGTSSDLAQILVALKEAAPAGPDQPPNSLALLGVGV